MCDPSTGETERRPSRLYFNGSPPSGGGFHGEKSAFREKLREPASLRKVGPVGAHLFDRILRVRPLHLDAPNRISQDAARSATTYPVDPSRPNPVTGPDAA